MAEAKGDRPIVWIGHAGPLSVSDLDIAIDFYATLGLRLIHRNDRIAALQLRGGTHLVIEQSDDPDRPREPPFDLMVEDLGAYREELLRAGLSTSPIETLRAHSRLTLTDPDGSQVQVYDSHVVGPA